MDFEKIVKDSYGEMIRKDQNIPWESLPAVGKKFLIDLVFVCTLRVKEIEMDAITSHVDNRIKPKNDEL